MSGVSDSGANGSADMQLIMDGSANWMARMTAFLQAKEDAEKAITTAGIVGEIISVRDEARAALEAAKKELADARASADTLTAYAQKQADTLLAKAKADADNLATKAQAAADEASKAAQASIEASAKKMAEADSLMALAIKRKADIDAMVEGLNSRSEALGAAQADAENAKAHFDALTTKLKDVLAELAGE